MEDKKMVLKEKDKESLSFFHLMTISIQHEQIKSGQELNSEEELIVLAREVKQRKNSLIEFEKAGHDDLVEKVKAKIVIDQKRLSK